MKVPTYERQVADAGPAQVRFDANPPGAGLAMAAAEKSGDGLGAIGKGLGDLAAGFSKLEADRDDAKVNEALNDYMARSSSLLYDPQKGFMNTRGAGADGVTGKSAEAHNSLRTEVAGKLNGRQRQLFMQNVANYDRSVSSSMMKHEGDAMSQWRTDQSKQLMSNTAAIWAKDPDFSMEAQEDAVRSIAIGLFGDQGEEANLSNIKAVRSSMIEQTALARAEDDPEGAQKFFDEYKSLMEPADVQTLAPKLTKAVMPVRAQAMGEELYKKFKGDLGDAEDYIRKTYSGDEENYYLGKAEGYFGDMKRAVAEDQARVFDNFVVQIGKHSAAASTIKTAINSDNTLNDKQKLQLSDAVDSEFKIGDYAPRRSGGGYSGGGGSDGGRVKTDRDTLMKLYNMVDKRQLFKDSPDWATFYNKYGTRLSTTDLKSFRSLYPGGAGGKGGKPAMSMNLMETFNKHMNNDKITDLQERAVYIDAFNAAHDEAVREKGAELTAQENELVMARVLEPVSVKSAEKSWWGGVKYKDLRRGDIPDGVTQNANGDYGVKDKNGHWHEVFWDNGSLSTGGKKPAQSKQKSSGKDWDIPAL